MIVPYQILSHARRREVTLLHAILVPRGDSPVAALLRELSGECGPVSTIVDVLAVSCYALRDEPVNALFCLYFTDTN